MQRPEQKLYFNKVVTNPILNKTCFLHKIDICDDKKVTRTFKYIRYPADVVTHCRCYPVWRYFVSQNSPVSYTGESRLPGVLCTGESFSVSLNLQAHAAAFKATLIQNTYCLILGLTIQIQFIHVWKIFLSQDFWVNSPVFQALGSHFKMLITQPNAKKNWNGPRKSPLGQGGAVWWKNQILKISWDCPFNVFLLPVLLRKELVYTSKFR